jgi:hypothetical protein
MAIIRALPHSFDDVIGTISVLDKFDKQSVSHSIAPEHGPDAYQPVWDVHDVFCALSFTEGVSKAISSIIHFTISFLFLHIISHLSEQEHLPQM